MKQFASITLVRRARNRVISKKIAPQTQFAGFKVVKIKVVVHGTGVTQRSDLLVELEDTRGEVFIWDVYERCCYYGEDGSGSVSGLDSDFYQIWNVTYGSELKPV